MLQNHWFNITVVTACIATPIAYLLFKKYRKRQHERKLVDEEKFTVLQKISTRQKNQSSEIDSPKPKEKKESDASTQDLPKRRISAPSYNTKHRDYSKLYSLNPTLTNSDASHNKKNLQRRHLPSPEPTPQSFHQLNSSNSFRQNQPLHSPPPTETVNTSAKREVEERRRIREEQDAAFQRSLEEDQIKAAILASEKDERERIARLEQEERTQRELLAEAKIKAREEKKKRLKKEPEEDEESCRIIFRLKEGKRLERRFRPCDTVADVFDFLETQGHLDEKEIKIATSYPRKELNIKEDGASTLQSLDLCPSSILNVFYEED